MKQIIFTLLAVVGICYTSHVYAQTIEKEIIKEENIILDDKNNEGKTTIEVKDGALYIDGKKISDIEKNMNLKIVKKNTLRDDIDTEVELFDRPFFNPREGTGMIARRAKLGVLTENANPGSKIKEVIFGSAAEKAGLQEGDIITAIDGKKVSDFNDLVNIIGEHNGGDEIKIVVSRNEARKTFTAKLDSNEMPDISNRNQEFRMPFRNFKDLFEMPGNGGMIFERSNQPKLGIGIEESAGKLEVINVEPSSAAAEAGIQQGDQIETIEDEKVSTLDEVKRELNRSKDNNEVSIGVKRNGANKNLRVVLPQAKRRAQF